MAARTISLSLDSVVPSLATALANFLLELLVDLFEKAGQALSEEEKDSLREYLLAVGNNEAFTLLEWVEKNRPSA